VGGVRKERTPMRLGTKLQIIAWKDGGKSWRWIVQQLGGRYSETAVKNASRRRAVVLARLAEAASVQSPTSRTTSYPEIDACILSWFHAVRARGRKRVPMSLAILRCKALQIATALEITNFTASNGFLQNWARRHGIVIVALHGCGASANIAEAVARMDEIRRQLAGVDPDLIYNVDETRLLLRGLPSRSYVPADDRRTARGSKSMKSKDRVTLTLCCNATGKHKLPITMIGKSMQPICFAGDGNEPPLPYFSQASAWTDSNIFARWLSEVFVPELRTRTGSQVDLILDNFKSHSRVSDPQVTVIELPPNITAVYQPLDAGFIAALKRRYKTRLLQRVVENLDQLITTGRSHPRVPRGGGLDEGGQAHLLDAAKIIVEAWDKISAEQLANCWLKADVLPTEAAAEVRRQVHGVKLVAENFHQDVSELVALMANTSMAAKFDGLTESARASALRRWLRAEDDAAAVDETVDMVLAGESDE